jgi:hypothetical protein
MQHMSTYTPDRWVLVKIQAAGKEAYYRVLAGWYGGYTQGDSWKLSSGLEKALEHDKHYEMPQSSGSTYLCYKAAYGMSSYMHSVFEGFKKDAEKIGMVFELLDEGAIPLLEAAPVKPEREPRQLAKEELKNLDF